MILSCLRYNGKISVEKLEKIIKNKKNLSNYVWNFWDIYKEKII